MKLLRACIRNFRRLENVNIDFEPTETVFVGPNNCGKTSATTAFRTFLHTQDFKIHDFSVPRLKEFSSFESISDPADTELPSISLDLWFSIDPDTEFGRAFELIHDDSGEVDTVGIRISFSVGSSEKAKLHGDFNSVFPKGDGDKREKSLVHFLSLERNLSKYFSLNYFALEEKEKSVVAHELSAEEGRRVLKSVLKADFVDAHRNMDDQESHRSNRLSAVAAAFYRHNLKQAKNSEAASKVIDANNDSLTEHYKDQFKDLFESIQTLGVPSINDRELEIVSSLSAETALQGSTELQYLDPSLGHRLPESYNGLGFKNLLYIAFQICHYHRQWMSTEKSRPLCHVVFVEEPEVHLHAQVQQTFISNIRAVINQEAKKAGKSELVPQLVLTSHSSHILDAVSFEKVRYFRRCRCEGEDATVKTLNASVVLSLKDFKPEKASADGETEDAADTLNFLRKYLRLTHCDLFFADAAILVEGSAEKLLMPTMIEKASPTLSQRYLTTLEVGGAHASKFASLFEFLGIPYLVITDIDTVDPKAKRKACRADFAGAVTSNASLRFFLGKLQVADLIALPAKDQIQASQMCYVAYQRPTPTPGYSGGATMHGRTFEEAFIYENLVLFREGKLLIDEQIPNGDKFEEVYKFVFEHVKSDSFKKTDFALDVASSAESWQVPTYIADGLKWLESQLSSAKA